MNRTAFNLYRLFIHAVGINNVYGCISNAYAGRYGWALVNLIGVALMLRCIQMSDKWKVK